MSVAIPGRAAKKQKSAERQEVGVDDPLQIGGTSPERGAD